jgi:hypothetical protein
MIGPKTQTYPTSTFLGRCGQLATFAETQVHPSGTKIADVFPTRTSAARMLALADHEISRFPSKECAHMPVSKTTLGRLGARVIAPIRVAFRHRNP